MDFTKQRFQLDLWVSARALPIRIYGRPLSEILDMFRYPAKPYRGLSIDYILSSTHRVLRRPFFMRDRRCLREGLLAFRFLEAAGFSPELHFGIDHRPLAGSDVRAHCWVVCGSRMVLNPPTGDMKEILVWPNVSPGSGSPTNLTQARFD